MHVAEGQQFDCTGRILLVVTMFSLYGNIYFFPHCLYSITGGLHRSKTCKELATAISNIFFN